MINKGHFERLALWLLILNHPMNRLQTQIIRWPTPKGNVIICSFCKPDDFRGWALDRAFCHYAGYKSLYTRRESLIKEAEHPEANVTVALANPSIIIGYGVLGYPGTSERWNSLGPGRVMEFKAIEVSRSWRSYRIGSAILDRCLTYPGIEEVIVFLVGYLWTWDLDWTRLSGRRYREMLFRLFEPFGFRQCQTNDPNIHLKPENMMMARIGENVPPELRKRFKWALYGL